MLEEDESILRELSKKCKNVKENNRYLALHAISKGYPVSSVAEIFCTDTSTIYRWIERWQQEKSLQDRPKEGRPKTFTEKEEKELKKLIKENNPKKYGINANIWDCKELQSYFAKKGKYFSRETIRIHLKSLGAHYVKANIKYAEADINEQRKFVKEFFRDLKKNSDVIILFQDETVVTCSAHKTYGWTFDKKIIVKSPQSTWKKLNQFGAVDPIGGQIIQMTSGQAKTPTFIKFLKKIKSKFPDKNVWIYLDNLPVHKSNKVKEFLEKYTKIELKFLPPYSPELNVKEEWWRHERRKLLGNKYFNTTHQLATSISWFVRKSESEEIRSICSLAHLKNILHDS